MHINCAARIANRKCRTVFALTVAALAALSAAPASARADDVEDLVHRTRVSMVDACREISRLRGTVYSIELDDDDDAPIYRVEVADDRFEARLKVDAVTGKILSERRDTVSQKTARLCQTIERSGLTACEFLTRGINETRGGIPYSVEVSLRNDELAAEIGLIEDGERVEVTITESRVRPAPAPEAMPRKRLEPATPPAAEPQPPPVHEEHGSTEGGDAGNVEDLEREADAARTERDADGDDGRAAPGTHREDASAAERPVRRERPGEPPMQSPPTSPRTIGPLTSGISADFDRSEVGKPPASWIFSSASAPWRVQAERSAVSAPNVLVHAGASGAPGPVPALNATTSFGDFVASVEILAVEGGRGAGGGLIWRARDERNFYACLLDPAREVFVFLRVQNGEAQPLVTTRIRVDRQRWHTIHVQMTGAEMVGYVDGREVLSAQDSTFTGEGMLGLWAPSDAVTQFDNLAAKVP